MFEFLRASLQRGKELCALAARKGLGEQGFSAVFKLLCEEK